MTCLIFHQKKIYQSATPDMLHNIYKKQKSDTSYDTFLNKSNATILGTIDDHDYGMNNGDIEFKFKRESGIAFLDFIGEDKSGLMYERAQKGSGVYGVKVFDFSREDGDYLLSDNDAGMDADLINDDDEIRDTQDKSRRVAIFLLDVRTNKTPWSEGIPNYNGDFLGEVQWKWFENSIRKSDASVNIIVNGLQVHSFRHPSSKDIELWSHFPSSRQRLYDAILQDNVQAPIIVSGDVHMAQFLRKDCIRTSDKNHIDPSFRPLVEITSSGMTHSWGTCFGCTDKLHTTWKYYPCHFLSKSLMTLAHSIFPMPDLMNSNNNGEGVLESYEHGGAENAREGKQYSLELNFGEFEFDWMVRTVRVRIFGKDSTAPPLLSATYTFDQLSREQTTPGNVVDMELSKDHGKYVMDGNLVDGEFICINHQGTPNPIFVKLGLVGLQIFLATFLLTPFISVLSVLFLIKNMRKRNKKKKD